MKGKKKRFFFAVLFCFAEEKLTVSSVQDLVIEEPKYQRELKQFVSTDLLRLLLIIRVIWILQILIRTVPFFSKRFQYFIMRFVALVSKTAVKICFICALIQQLRYFLAQGELF